ncbi:MAG: hypothetical protein HYY06_00955 [Deltaproteobacteria bacterium]|nr:hypothetical protein [Deltaproteobacteria bacterium]
MTRGRLFVPAIATAILASLAAYAWPFTIDDAYIPCRYAANLAAGRGLVWQPGDAEPAQGVTSIAWPLILALVRSVGVRDLPAAAKLLGLACGLACVAWILARAARSVGGGRVAVLALACLAPSLSAAAYSVAGLETSAFTLLVTLAACSAMRRPGMAGLIAGSSFAVRPEGAVVLIALAAVVPGRRRVRFLAAAVVPVAAALLVQWMAFGRLVPDTFHARAAPPGAGLAYVAGALVPTGAAFLWPLALVAAARRSLRPMVAVVVALVAAVAWEGGDWMPGWRFLVPVWPLTSLLAAHGAMVGRVRLGRRRLAFAPLGLLGLGALVGCLSTLASLPDVRTAGIERERGAPRLVAALRRLDARTVALVDVGYVGWSGFETVDLGGLTDRRIARAPGVYLDKEVDEAYLLARRPDAIVLHVEGPRGRGMFPVERRVASMPAVLRDYRLAVEVQRAPTYRYLVLRRSPGSSGG